MNNMGKQFKMDISLGKARETCVFKGKNYRISVLSDCLIRLEYNEKGVFNDYPTIFAINRLFSKAPSFTVKQDENFLNITNDYFILEYAKEKPFEASKLVPDSNLRITLKDTDKIWYFNNPEVKNYKGAAESFDMSNKLTLDRGLYNIDGFASFDDTSRPVFVSDGTIRKNPSDGTDIYVFLYKKDFKKALESYYELTGYPSLLPRYALGLWWNKDENYNMQTLKEVVNNFDKNEIPFSTFLLGDKAKLDEKGNKFANFALNKQKFCTPELVNFLHEKNVYLGLNMKLSNGFLPGDSVYNEAKTILNVNNEIPLPINVYNSNILNLYLKEIDELTKEGIDYFWLDDKNSDKILSFMFLHYTFNNYMKNENKRGLVLSRNPKIATHRYPVSYSGVTEVSWRTLKYLPYYNITSSNIGLSMWSHDIGGFENGIEDAELYTRYIQFGVYSPIMRLSSKEGRYYKREPWLWDVKTLKIVKDYIRIRHRLIPYLYSEAYRYSKEGKPLIKALYYTYPEVIDEPLYRNEYYFGSEFFICPITDSKDKVMNRVLHRIYLPEGTWYDFKTGKKYPGGKRYVTFYKDEDYPVYAKSGAIIPMAMLDEEDLNNVKPPKKLEIQVFPGESNSYNLYEDDGVSNLYKEGYYLITNIDYNYRQNNYTLIIRPIEGKSGIIPDKRDYKIRFRNTKEAENVKVYVGKNEIDFTSYTSDTDFIIEIKDVPTVQQLTINCGGKAIEIDAVRLINEDIDGIISDLQIETNLKERIANILFSDAELRRKRIEIRKLKRYGLNSLFVKMFIKLLDYIGEI